MQLHDIIAAWNAQANEYNQWEDIGSDTSRAVDIGADEMVEFALRYVESEARSALDDLGVAVYSPDESSISVDHAIGHVKQVFSTIDRPRKTA